MTGLGSSSYVYVVAGPAGLVKVGHSTDLPGRLRSLQTGSPYPLRVAYARETPSGARAIEQAAHADLRLHRRSGEWFEVPIERAVQAIDKAIADLGLGREVGPAVGLSWESPAVSRASNAVFRLGVSAIFAVAAVPIAVGVVGAFYVLMRVLSPS